MADSPGTQADGPVRVAIMADGKQISDELVVLSIATTKKVGRIPVARIELADGDLPDRDFPVSNEETFTPGTEIAIKAGYGPSEKVVFEGLILKHGIRVDGSGPSRLVIECQDKAVTMTVGRKSANYLNAKDSEVMAELIAQHSGLSADIGTTNATFGELVQYYCTDWDFMVSRAEANGMLVVVDDGKISIKEPAATTPELTVTYGIDLIEFEADIDAGSQTTEAQAFSWDPKTQEVVKGKVANPDDVGKQGNLSGKKLAKVLGAKAHLQTATPLAADALASWGTGQQVKAGLARIRGHMKFQGNAKPKPGTQIQLKGVGKRFEGNVFVTAVQHDISPEGWVTIVEFGLAPDWHADRRDLTAPSAAGLLPGVDGLQIGIVKKLDEDPDGENRVQVSVPLLQAEDDGIWARLASFYGSKQPVRSSCPTLVTRLSSDT